MFQEVERRKDIYGIVETGLDDFKVGLQGRKQLGIGQGLRHDVFGVRILKSNLLTLIILRWQENYSLINRLLEVVHRLTSGSKYFFVANEIILLVSNTCLLYTSDAADEHRDV